MNLSTVKWAQWDKTQSRDLLGLFICVCIALCTIVAHNIAQNRPDNFPSYPPDNHHCSDDVYLREGGLPDEQKQSSCVSHTAKLTLQLSKDTQCKTILQSSNDTDINYCCAFCISTLRVEGCVGRLSCRTFSTDFEIFRWYFDSVVIYFFNSDFSIFTTTSRNFQSLLCMLFLFSLQSSC